MMAYFPLILSGIVLNVIAQVVLKFGMNRVGFFDFTWGNFMPVTLQIARNPFILGGVFCYVFSMGIWLMVLSRLDVSQAYPLTSIGYILTAFVGFWFLDESLTPLRLLGIVIIMVGVYLVSRG